MEQKSTAPGEEQHQAQQEQAEYSHPILLKTQQAAELLGISRSKLYDLINREHLPVVYIGRSIRIRPSSLHAWIQEHEQQQ